MAWLGRTGAVRRSVALLIFFGASVPAGKAAPANYHTLTPCRLLDSRLSGPPLSSGVPRTIAVGGVCGVPASATSVALNVTVVAPTSLGYLRVYATGPAPSPFSALNFSAGQTRGNNVLVQLSAGGQVDVLPTMPAAGTVHVILDVFGYFVDDAPPTAVDDAKTVAEDAPATTIDVLANDTDPDGGPISVTSVTQPANGAVAITAGGTAVTYQPSADYCNTPPGSSLDTFTYDLFPGGSSSTVTVTVTCVNDPPVVAGTGTATFTEDGPPVPVAPVLTVTDVDDTNLESARVTIANLLDAGAETLAASTAGTAIAASYTAPVLTLTGTDTVANYQLVLRRVTYEDTSANPTLAARSVTFVANDGSVDSAPATATVTVAAANDAPTLTPGAGSPTFTEDGPPVAVDPGLAAADADSANLASATVTITNLLDAGAETLAATTAGTAITSSYAAPTLTLNGTDTVAHYQQVLRSVTYANSAQNPATTARSVAFVVNDGTANSNTAIKLVAVLPVNDAPVLAAGGVSATFTEDGPPVAVDPGVTATDVDDTNLASATVTITNLLDAGAETLAATTAGTAITASYVAPTLTLTGTDTVAHYQQVLRTVAYANSSQNPSTAARSVAFVANDGTANSNTATTTVAITAVNDAPVLTGGGGSPAYTENGPPVAVDPALGVSDADNTSLASATVTITNLLDAGKETLAASTAGTSITASYAAPTLTLSGPDTVAHYQQVLRSVTYANSSENPTTTARVVSFAANDGALGSNTVTKSVTVNAVADAPVLTPSGAISTFIEDGPAVAVDSVITATDVDSTNLASATVTITNVQNVGAELLAASTAGTSIVASYVAPTLTLTGSDTLAHYEQVLRRVTYDNTSQNPSTVGRVVSFVASDGVATSTAVMTVVNVVAVNDSPALAGTGTVTFTEDAGAVTVAPVLTASDVDNTSLVSATVTITNLLNVGAEALAANTTGTSIVAGYAAPTLTLTGSDTLAAYQAVLRSVTYNNTSQGPNATSRNVTFVVNDAPASNSNTAIATVQVVPVNDAPALTTNPITYTTAGHSQLHVAGATLPGVASISDPQSILTKSAPTDIDGPVALAVVPASGTTANGGSFDIAANGAFTYVPGLGFSGTDSFTYQVTDSVTPVTGTVNVTVSPVVWYVHDVTGPNNPAGGDGRSTDAFETLTAAQAASGTGHTIFVFAGDTATTPHTSGITLKDGQKLIGEGVGLSVPGIGTIVAAGGRPHLVNTGGDAVSIPATAANRDNVEVRGMDLQGSANAVDVTATGTNTVSVTISNNLVRGAGQEGIDLNAGSTGLFTATVQTNDITATGTGFDARRTAAGSLRVDFSGNTVLSTGGAGVVVDGSGGPTTVTGFANNSVNGSTLGLGIQVNTATFDATPGGAIDTVSGGSTTVGASGTGNGVGGSGLLLTNVAGALAFTNLQVFADGGDALRINGTGPFTGTAGTLVTVPAGVATLQAVGGAAVDVTSATVDLRLAGLSSVNSTGRGVSLTNVADSTLPAPPIAALFDAGASSTISGAAGTAFNVSGGNAGITYAGSIAGTRAIVIANHTGSRAVTLSGTITLATSGLTAFSASNNTNSLGIEVTGAANTINATNATALSVTSTIIGAGGLHFQRLSASGATNGIVLSSTGALGGLTVTGTGSAGSGGVVQNMSGDGISLTNTRSVSLANMNVTNNLGSGIAGDDVTDLTLTGSNVTNNGDTATGDEAGLRFDELLGTATITNCTISGSSEDNVRLTPASGALDLKITGTTIGPNSAATGGNGVTILDSGTASVTVSVTGSTFTQNRAAAFLGSFAGSGAHDVTVSNDVFRDNGKAVSLGSNTSTSLTFSVVDNAEIVRSESNALELLGSSDSTSAMQLSGTFGNNVVGNGTPDSGSRDWNGIAIDLRGDERSILAVTGNSIRNVDFQGIFVSDADFGGLAGTPSADDLTVRDNVVQQIDDNSGFPCGAPYGTLVDFRHTTVGCLDMASNTSAESPNACGAAHFRLRQRDTSTFKLERLTDGDGTPNELINNVAIVQSHVVTQNDPGSTANVTLVTGFTEAANGTCAKP
jgi:VCBS repeat-containing protein